MRHMEKQIKKLNKGIKDSFTHIDSNGNKVTNYTCSQGRMVEVDYFALQDLIEFYEETKKAASQVIIAREALVHAYWPKEPLPDD